MITMEINGVVNTPEQMLVSLKTEGELDVFIDLLDREYNDPSSTMLTKQYVQLRQQATTKKSLIRLRGPA